jgi:hypothetical protein
MIMTTWVGKDMKRGYRGLCQTSYYAGISLSQDSQYTGQDSNRVLPNLSPELGSFIMTYESSDTAKLFLCLIKYHDIQKYLLLN